MVVKVGDSRRKSGGTTFSFFRQGVTSLNVLAQVGGVSRPFSEQKQIGAVSEDGVGLRTYQIRLGLTQVQETLAIYCELDM